MAHPFVDQFVVGVSCFDWTNCTFLPPFLPPEPFTLSTHSLGSELQIAAHYFAPNGKMKGKGTDHADALPVENKALREIRTPIKSQMND